MNSSIINYENFLKCCNSNNPTRKIIYDAGNDSSYVMLLCEEHYKIPSNQLFILKEEQIQ